MYLHLHRGRRESRRMIVVLRSTCSPGMVLNVAVLHADDKYSATVFALCICIYLLDIYYFVLVFVNLLSKHA